MGLAAGNLRENIYNVESVALDILHTCRGAFVNAKSSKKLFQASWLGGKAKKGKAVNRIQHSPNRDTILEH